MLCLTRSFYATSHFSYSELTLKKCMWAHHIFHEWKFSRNCRTVTNPSLVHIDNDLVDMSVDEMVFALPRFIMEVCKKSGDNYPAETLYEIVVCLQLFLATKGRTIKILDECDFSIVRNTLDNCMKEFTKRTCYGKWVY